MDNYINFINNLRAGLAEADRQANNFINQAGNEMGKAFNMFTTPFRAVGDQIGQSINTAINGGQQNAQPTQQQPARVASVTMPVTNPQPQAQQPNQNMTYFVRDPAIDGFVNTLRFMMNPLNGITGWTPLNMVTDTVSDSMYSTFGKKYTPTTENTTDKKTDTTDTTETTKPTEEAKLASTDDSDVVTYTYKPGDTFGQVVLDLGLGTANGLWGANGDVDYYTKQLIDQGALNAYGNIPIGTTIKLRRRK